MGTWPIYKKTQTFPTTDLNKKKDFHLIKYLLTTFIFFLSFQSVLVYLAVWNLAIAEPADVQVIDRRSTELLILAINSLRTGRYKSYHE